MKFKCLRCNIPLSTEFQLIFDETGIELQLDKLLTEHFEISVIRDPNTTQALCDECVNKLVELYDTQVYKEEKLEFTENDESNQTEIEQTRTEDDVKEEESNEEDMIIEEIEYEIENENENEEDYEELIEESTLTDNEEFYGFNEAEENEDNGGRISNLDGISLQDYLQNVIKSDLGRISFDQNSVCRLCDTTLNSHDAVLMHVLDNHEFESEQFPCIFCENLKYFDSITNLAHHIVLKHYDLNSITIYCMCPECNSRFSSFLDYNKHSCYKTKINSRLQQECTECKQKFISNKRYRFHLQFHLKKQRPKACFICDILFSDENEFFEHIMFSHEKDGSFVCKKCDRVCTTKQLYDNHMKLHDAVRSFQCQYCSKSYLYNQMLINHIQQHHSDEQSNECKICKKSLANRHLLTRHMQLVHQQETENDVFVCTGCGLIGISEEDTMFHMDDKCPEAEINIECLKIAYACEFCELAFKNIENLKEHRSIHKDNIFKCWICESTYPEYKKLKTHILTHNNIEPIQKSFPINRHYVCNIDSCEQSYLTWPSLRAHKVRHPTKLNCEICRQTFTTESKLNIHLKSHDDNNEEYSCHFCSKVCISQMSLSVHIARKHNNNCKTCPTCKSTCSSEEALKEHIDTQHTEVKCDECGKITKNKRNLAVHIQMIHGQVKRFFCSICNKGYFNKSDLKTHERAVHAEPNKFKCQYCNFSSSYEASFKAHLLKHDQNKPFKCGECSREFTRKACYKLHLLRHSDNKPFVCPVAFCGRSFVMPGILNSHIKNAHPECKESNVKRTPQRPAKRKRQNPQPQKDDVESANSSDYVITEVYSESEYLDGEGGIVIFDGTNADDEEIMFKEEGNMYIE